MKARYVWCDACNVSRKYGDRCEHHAYEVVETVKRKNRSLYSFCEVCFMGVPKASPCAHKMLENRRNSYSLLSNKVKRKKAAPMWYRDMRKQKCFYCGGEGRTVDHKVPRSKGGPFRLSNALPACVKCNGQKGSMSYEEFVEWKAKKRAR